MNPGYSRTNPSHPLHLDVFVDLQCPYSAKAYQTLKEVQKQYEDKLHFVLHLSALPIHYSAFLIFQAANIVAKDAGIDQFFEFVDLAFANQLKVSNAQTASLTRHEIIDVLWDWAMDCGLENEEGFKLKMANWDYTKVCLREWQYSVTRQVVGTPKFILNGFLLHSLDSSSTLADWNKKLRIVLKQIES